MQSGTPQIRKWLATLFVLLAAASVCPGQTRYLVFPTATDPLIDPENNSRHCAYYSAAVTARGRLLVMLPGTWPAKPWAYQELLKTAANLGIHSIALSYVNTNAINRLCDISDCECFEDVRLEIIDGTERSTLTFVDRPNSIENRLNKLLLHLDTNHPTVNWRQFLDAQTNAVWSNIVVAGHSQGGGHAGVIAKYHKVIRCIMFASTDWCNHGGADLGPAYWITNNNATPSDRYHGFVHTNDSLVTTNQAAETWGAFGMQDYGPILTFEEQEEPLFSYSHSFMTYTDPQNTGAVLAFHNVTVIDNHSPTSGGDYVFRPLWEYMLTAPTIIPTVRIDQASGSMANLSWEGREFVNYQVQTSTNLEGTWSNDGVPAPGSDLTMSTNAVADDPKRFFRLLLWY